MALELRDRIKKGRDFALYAIMKERRGQGVDKDERDDTGSMGGE
jgi:hypothetical protein